MFVFGPGVITITPANVLNPTPFNIGYAQEISYEESFTNKAVFGQNRRALAIGAGTIKATGKIKAARWSISALSALLYGAPPSPGQTTTAIAEAGTVPAGGGTITVANGATFAGDQGVIYAATGKPLTRISVMGSQATTGASGTGSIATVTFASQTNYPPVGSTVTVAGVTPAGYNGTFVVAASGPTFVSYANATTGVQTVAGTIIGVQQAGQYSVNTATGVYTYVAGDANAKVQTTYNYTVAASGYSLLGSAQLLGPTVTFGLNITATDPTNNNIGTLQVFSAVVSKWAFATKLEEFNMPEFDYEAYANAAGNAYQWNSPDNF